MTQASYATHRTSTASQIHTHLLDKNPGKKQELNLSMKPSMWLATSPESQHDGLLRLRPRPLRVNNQQRIANKVRLSISDRLCTRRITYRHDGTILYLRPHGSASLATDNNAGHDAGPLGTRRAGFGDRVGRRVL
ncbi:predicted protein [Plenodomus lingam JN3]|uniref:Predicted protein n=1 Tax=Leptosphaeria maculans (strain JN3 / isolate v23.1.3 / race Av1-4-5-6-7-8) TaxID=985895 RepID=E4ZV37_LEPMJ|nr:predicted protein [Plenodomus lingam JN3]CBX95463.1 predicted protein [Plenodomus lingam JN3]